jgi:hypothetical protein
MNASAGSFRWVMAGLLLLPLSFALTGVCLLAAWGREMILRFKAGAWRDFTWSASGRLWVALLGLGAVATACSVDPVGSLPTWLGEVGCALIFLVGLWVFDTPRRLSMSHKALFWVGVAMGVFGLGVYAANLHVIWQPLAGVFVEIGSADRRINSVMFHPNLLAGYLVLALGLGLGLFHEAFAPARKLRYGLGLGVLALTLVLTASREGWLGGGILLFSFGLLVDRRWLLALGVSALSAFLIFPSLIVSRLSGLWWGSPDFDKYRLMAWESALKMIQARPLTGWGPGMWHEAYPAFRMPEETRHLPHAHNYFLQLATGFGLPAAALFVGMVVWILVRAYQETRHTQYHGPVVAVCCACLGYIAPNLFDVVLMEGRNSVAFFLLLGGAEAARRLAIADRPMALKRPLTHTLTPRPEEPNP